MANAFVTQARAALQCVARAEVFGSGSSPGFPNALTIVSAGRGPADRLILRNRQRAPYLLLDVSVEYTVAYLPEEAMRQPYRTVTTNYAYAILDLSGKELFAYHWHPEGVSHVKTPHLHFSGALPISLPMRPGSPEATELWMGHAHFPTRRIDLAQLVRFLIRDFDVEPRRPDWDRVLSER